MAAHDKNAAQWGKLFNFKTKKVEVLWTYTIDGHLSQPKKTSQLTFSLCEETHRNSIKILV